MVAAHIRHTNHRSPFSQPKHIYLIFHCKIHSSHFARHWDYASVAVCVCICFFQHVSSRDHEYMCTNFQFYTFLCFFCVSVAMATDECCQDYAKANLPSRTHGDRRTFFLLILCAIINQSWYCWLLASFSINTWVSTFTDCIHPIFLVFGALRARARAFNAIELKSYIFVLKWIMW